MKSWAIERPLRGLLKIWSSMLGRLGSENFVTLFKRFHAKHVMFGVITLLPICLLAASYVCNANWTAAQMTYQI